MFAGLIIVGVLMVLGMGMMAAESEMQRKRSQSLAKLVEEKNEFIKSMSESLEELKKKSEEREAALLDAAMIVAGVEEKSKSLNDRITELTDMINNDREYIVELEDELKKAKKVARLSKSTVKKKTSKAK